MYNNYYIMHSHNSKNFTYCVMQIPEQDRSIETDTTERAGNACLGMGLALDPVQHACSTGDRQLTWMIVLPYSTGVPHCLSVSSILCFFSCSAAA